MAAAEALAPSVAGDLADLVVEVLFSPGPGRVEVCRLTLAAGATLADAVQASGLPGRWPVVRPGETPAGIWGKCRSWDHPLRQGDRVELYRPLLVDPKEARRQRFKRHRDGLKKAPRRAAGTDAPPGAPLPPTRKS